MDQSWTICRIGVRNPAEAIDRLVDEDALSTLRAVARELRRTHPGDAETDVVARQVERQQLRLTLKN